MNYAHAHVLTRFGEPLRDRRYPLPSPGPGEILLGLEVSGVCGSDVHQCQGLDPRVPLPLIPGHEGVGRILAMGGTIQDVQGFRLSEGDRITFNRGVSCMSCRTCVVQRQPALCPHRWVYGITRSCAEPPHLVGCYASHVLLAAGVQTLCLDDTLSPVVAVTAGCSGATAAHCFEEARPGFGSRVVIQGPGPIGAYCAAFAKASGAEVIVVVGGTASRLGLCVELGATHVINRRETTAAERLDEILELTGGEGADVVYEAAGDQAAISEGLKWVRTGGAYVSCGVAEPRGGLEIDFFHDIARRNARLQGIWVSDMRHLVEAVRLVEGRPEAFEGLVDGRFAFEDANEALRAVAAREVRKAVLIHGNVPGSAR